MGKNVSEQLLDALVKVGVQRVYGVTGDALNHFVTAIHESKDINWMGFKHEENAAFAAFGDSETSGQLAVCAGTVGPGALHLINGLYNAKKERTPVIAVTGQVPLAMRGTNFFQEVDLTRVFDDCCAYQGIIRSPEDAPRVIRRAIQKAINDRAVCRIELSSDIAGMDAVHDDFLEDFFYPKSALVPDEATMESAAALINDAKTVTIFAGHGCRGAREEVLELSRHLNAPITHTLKASDIFDRDTENVVGLTGLVGNPSGFAAVVKAEVLIMLGTDFPYDEFLPHDTKIIQVDIRAENLGNRVPVDVGVHAHVLPFVKDIKEKVSAKTDSKFLDKNVESFKKWKASSAKKAEVSRGGDPIHPQIFAGVMDKHASDDAIFSLETGSSIIWGAHHVSYHSDRRIIGSFNHGSMAVGLPAIMGAQFAFPDRECWCLSGDGAFNMCLQDFITAVRYELPIKVIVFNNGSLAFVKLEMELDGLAPTFEELREVNFDFAEYAKLCGGDGVRVEKAEDIEEAMLQAKNSKKPFIIDAVVSPGEISMPPKVTFEMMAKFGSSKVKELVQVIGGDKEQWENIKQELDSLLR